MEQHPWTHRARERMQALGLSQEKMAKVLACTRGAVGHYLSGRRSPTLDQLELIATELQVDPCWLIFGGGKVQEAGSTYHVSSKAPCSLPVQGTTSNDAVTKGEIIVDPDDLYALLIKGDQWAPRYGDGEVILLSSSMKPSSGYELWVRYKDGSKDLIKLVRKERKRITYESLAEQGKQRVTQTTKIEYMHCVLGVVQKAGQAGKKTTRRKKQQ